MLPYLKATKRHRVMIVGVSTIIAAFLLIFILIYAQTAPDRSGAFGVDEISKLSPNGTILYKNQPFFPFGFNHDSAFVNKTNLINAINNIKSAGFNALYFQPSENMVDVLNLTRDANGDKSKDLKLFIDGDGAINNGYEGVINAYKNTYDNIIGWSVADDFNSTTQPKTYTFVKNNITTVENLDKSRLTFMSGTGAVASWVVDATEYLKNTPTEVMAIQNYPIGDSTTEIGEIYEYTSRLVPEAHSRGKAYIAQLQSFKWDDGRLPTYAEVRNMTWQALAADVDGILFYTYAMEGWNLGGNALWNEFKNLPAEINPHLSMVLNGTYTPYTSYATYKANKRVVAASWNVNGRKFLLVVNASRNARTETVNITNLSGTFTPVLSSMTGGNLNVVTGNNTFAMADKEVRLYVQEATTTPPTPPTTPPPCASYEYSAWSTCTNGTQTRTVTTKNPLNCSGGTAPILSQSCTPTCTSITFSAWSACVNGQQSRTAIGTPTGCTPSGDPGPLTQACTNTCTSVTYSDWGACVNGSQSRTVISALPAGCTGGTILLTQTCSTGPVTCTGFNYSGWSACVNGTQTRTITSATPTNCTGGNPLLSQSCTIVPNPNECGNMDVNGDSKLTIVDLARFASLYGKTCIPTPPSSTPNATACGPLDVNGDGRITAIDMSKFSSNYNKPACNSN